MYDDAFFARQIEGSSRSASVVVPLILRMFPDLGSVVDVGCGAGCWLSALERRGISEILGLDGVMVAKPARQIPDNCILVRDLNVPLRVPKRFDLCLSLEVAEHLDPDRSHSFVEDLCLLSDVVVFSAAVPGQGGTGHVNERWLPFWIDLFRAFDYQFFDALRPYIWDDDRVDWWYAQNTVIFVARSSAEMMKRVGGKSASCEQGIFNIVHPRCLSKRLQTIAHRSPGE